MVCFHPKTRGVDCMLLTVRRGDTLRLDCEHMFHANEPPIAE